MTGSALWLSELGSIDTHGVASMAQAAEQSIDERLVAKEVIPLLVVEIRGNNRWPLTISLFHELEEDVGLLGFEIEISQLVDDKHVNARQPIDQLARGAVGQRRVHLVE